MRRKGAQRARPQWSSRGGSDGPGSSCGDQLHAQWPSAPACPLRMGGQIPEQCRGRSAGGATPSTLIAPGASTIAFGAQRCAELSCAELRRRCTHMVPTRTGARCSHGTIREFPPVAEWWWPRSTSR